MPMYPNREKAMEGLIIGWVLCGIIGAMIGSRKGAGCSGFLLGILLGPLGIIISIVMRGDRKACPYCKELIQKDAVKCPKCGAILSDSQQVLSKRVIKWVKKCPRCAELIKKDAMMCRYCRYEFSKEDVISELLAALKGGAQSRMRSIECLSTIEDKSVAPHLLKALIDAELHFLNPSDFVPVQDKAKMTLLKIRDKSVIPKIESIVRQGGERRQVAIAVELLGEFGELSSVPVLIDALEHEAIRQDAAVALEKIGRPAVSLLENARKERKRAVRKVVERILKAIDSGL
jgi:RNA polymerase subunit RPABC4/transcription elongation factor Spt4